VVDFAFHEVYTLSGTVRDADSNPVPGAAVAAAPGNQTTSTTANGAYTLTLTAGTYTVSALKSGYPMPDVQSVSVPPSRTDVDFVFPPRYSICGTV
jgi:hypothetical protein